MNEQKPVVVGDIKPSLTSKLKSRLKKSADKKDARRRPKSIKLAVAGLVFLLLVGGAIFTYWKINSKPKNPNTVTIDGKTYQVKLITPDKYYPGPAKVNADEVIKNLKAKLAKDPSYANYMALITAYMQHQQPDQALIYLNKAKASLNPKDKSYKTQLQSINDLINILQPKKDK